MKQINIDFAPKRAWRWVWAVAFLLISLTILRNAWHWQEGSKVTELAKNKLSDLTLQSATASKPRSASPNAKDADLIQIGELLSGNFNHAFTAAENMKEPGAQLKALSYDAAANTLRLEYELDSMVRTSAVTAQLNASNAKKPWTLDSAALSEGTLPNSTNKVRAAWTGKLSAF